MKREIEQSKISPAVFELIDGAIGVPPHERDFLVMEALNDVYKACSHLDNNFIEALSALEMNGVISKDEKLLLFVLHMTARDLGPFELKKLRDSILDPGMPTLSPEEVNSLSLSTKTKFFIRDVIVRLGL